MSINQLKWLNHYNKLCNRGKERGLNKKNLDYYTERHHIVPKCIGGSDEEDNLVLLTAREHYIAHQLLVKIYPNNYKLSYAVKMLCMKTSSRNNREYEWVKIKFAKACSETLKGRTKETHQYLFEMSEKLKGRTKETHLGVKKQSEALSGRTKQNNEIVKRISEMLSGRTKENYEYLKKAGEKIKGRTKETHLGIKNMSEKLTGRTKHTHEGLKISGEKRKILSNEQEQELYQLRMSGLSGKEIQHHFKSNYNISIIYSSISTIYNRIKKENERLKTTNTF
jgi:hypothetical protein